MRIRKEEYGQLNQAFEFLIFMMKSVFFEHYSLEDSNPQFLLNLDTQSIEHSNCSHAILD
jgi:hypothetical protein